MALQGSIMNTVSSIVAVVTAVVGASIALGAGTAAADRVRGSTEGWGEITTSGSASYPFTLNVGRSLSYSSSGNSTTVAVHLTQVNSCGGLAG
jgi:hypothetical protein